MKKSLCFLLCVLTLLALLSGCNTGRAPSSESEAESDPQSEASLPEAGEDPPENDPPEDDPSLNDWAFDPPENHGMDAEILQALHEALRDVEINAMVTVKDGFLVDEYYKEGYDETSVFRLASCSKSFTGALVGIAIDEGLIRDVDTPISEYLPLPEDSDKREITIRHLLEHTSGIEWYEWGGNGTSFRDLVGSENWVEYVLDQRVVAAPGSTFNYTTGGPHLLAAILAEATGMSAYDYALEHLFQPMGMDSAAWAADDQGVTDGGNGIAMTARDAAKFGQLYLGGGSWNGRQLVPAEWVAQSTLQQSEGAGRSGVYGYQWWIRSFGDSDYDTYYAMGHAGQFIFVVPELELVTVITSRMSQDTYAPWPYFTDYILAACDTDTQAA